ncbi:hypothetical protein B2J88_20145 [Rhodococcus sp. SRB_17]|nr:hypothetical protein [Acidovorax sp. SRB_24]NMM86649.1 hypothetical protein [Rhodococcus sp. SRB_17]
MVREIVFCIALLSAAAPGWAVNKCTGPDGKVSFQDGPCAGKGEKLDVRPASGGARAAVPERSLQAPMPPADAALPLPGAAVLPTPTAPIATKSLLTREADECLSWYRPKLRDPAGAYYTGPLKNGRVLSITIHATNGYGGYVTQRGSCEFNNGKLDGDWTKIHATRDGW